MAPKKANRRKYPRIRAPIYCRPAGEDFFAQNLEPVDISFGGLRTYSDEEYQVGAFVRLDLFLSGGAPVTVSAEVMWIKTLGRGAPARFDVGLAFVDLRPDALDVLRRLLSQTEPSESAPAAKVAPRRAARPKPPAPDLTLDFHPAEPITDVRPVAPKAGSLRPAADPRTLLARIPMILVEAERLRATKLDARAGFLVALVDGVTPVEALLDLSGMPPQETLDLIEDLRRRGIIALH
jgi:PilZ domain